MWFPEYFKDLNSVDSNLTVTDTGFSNETILTQLRIYQDTLYISLATLPGTIVGILLVGLAGGKILLGIIYVAVTGRKRTTVCGLIRLVISLAPDFLRPFMND